MLAAYIVNAIFIYNYMVYVNGGRYLFFLFFCLWKLPLESSIKPVYHILNILELYKHL